MGVIRKQLKTKINNKEVDFFPITDTEAVMLEDETTLQEKLDYIEASTGNIFGVVNENVSASDETAPKFNAETLGGYSANDFVKQTEIDEYVTETELSSTLDSYAKSNEVPTKLSDLENDMGFSTVTDTNTTYKLTKNNSTITLTGSDGSTYSVTDSDTNTTYTKLSQFTNDSGYITGITKDMIIKALGYTPSSSTDTNTTYKLSKSGTTIKLTGSDGSTTSVTDANTTYSKLSEFTNDKGYITEISKEMIIDALGYTPSSSTTSGSTGSLSDLGITATATELNKLDGVTATTTELNYVDGVTSNIQTQLDNKAPKTHSHTISEISNFPSTMTPSAHNQSASTITAGTFAGNVVAPTSTSYTTAHIRNIKFTTTDPGEGASASEVNGTLLCVYED